MPDHTRQAGPSNSSSFEAPARVNLLGEHTDYTGGFVLPMAIPFHTEATITPGENYSFSSGSSNFPEVRTMDPGDRSPKIGEWSDYPVGVLRQLQARGIEPPPFHLHVAGNVPSNSGVSSSASLEVATAYALLAFTGKQLPLEDIAVLCRAAENDYVGSPCGIMDQFSIAAAKAGHALLLNTRTLKYEHLPMNQGDLAQTQIVVCNSMVKHSVASGEYGVRHQQVMEGQQALISQFPTLRDLGDASLDQLEAARPAMSLESYLRCRHIISDNARVMQAKDAMFAGDPVVLGKLMLAGHASERDDFGCSCDEVDFLVETASAQPGCFGARLTGGGFGGCTVNLVDRARTAAFVDALRSAYQAKFTIAADIFVCDAVDGADIRNQTEHAQP